MRHRKAVFEEFIENYYNILIIITIAGRYCAVCLPTENSKFLFLQNRCTASVQLFHDGKQMQKYLTSKV